MHHSLSAVFPSSSKMPSFFPFIEWNERERSRYKSKEQLARLFPVKTLNGLSGRARRQNFDELTNATLCCLSVGLSSPVNGCRETRTRSGLFSSQQDDKTSQEKIRYPGTGKDKVNRQTRREGVLCKRKPTPQKEGAGGSTNLCGSTKRCHLCSPTNPPAQYPLSVCLCLRGLIQVFATGRNCKVVACCCDC
mmetsp:Transcript_42627/g.84070  ORF Transcript_42627/g.84070 Transcript_42627/m.84070 type:complete len:192 (-) Transcript_42627:47-622(-)